MAKKIFTKISLFDYNQPIFIADKDDIKLVDSVPINNVKKVLFSLLSDNDDVEEIEFNGNEKYIKTIGEEMINEIITKYSNNKNVRITINGKIFN